MKILIKLGLCALCLSTVSCATVVRGTTEDVVIRTSPEDAKVVTSFHHTCTTNPCTVKVARKDSFQVTASKPGYKTQTVNVGTKISGKGAAGMAGNIVAGGLVGVGVDAVTGAGKDHWPNPVIINLQPTGSVDELKPTTLPPVTKPGSKTVPVS